jgi:hypothetical protein
LQRRRTASTLWFEAFACTTALMRFFAIGPIIDHPSD